MTEIKPLTTVVHDEDCMKHDTGLGHPESPQRYAAIIKALRDSDFVDRLRLIDPRKATDEELQRVHAASYIDIAKGDIRGGRQQLSTGDTVICPASLDAALFAAGGACCAVDEVFSGRAKNAFCVMRPPGHHATPRQGMGFCIFNNIAVAARYAQTKYQIGKVLIVDWDVHHGNGTQDVFYDDDTVFFFSTHQSPWYPGTGAKNETGRGKGLGTTLNRPFPAGSGRQQIVTAFSEDLASAVERFQPELVLVSAGFDSRIGDPLGQFRLTDEDFADLTRLMMDLARQHADGRLISVLEGGYNLDGLAKAATAHCRALTTASE